MYLIILLRAPVVVMAGPLAPPVVAVQGHPLHGQDLRRHHHREFIPLHRCSSIRRSEPHRHDQIMMCLCSAAIRGSDHPLPQSGPPPLRRSEEVSCSTTVRIAMRFTFSGFTPTVLMRDAWATMFTTDPTPTSRSWRVIAVVGTRSGLQP
jgi:hypothetical protein